MLSKRRDSLSASRCFFFSLNDALSASSSVFRFEISLSLSFSAFSVFGNDSVSSDRRDTFFSSSESAVSSAVISAKTTFCSSGSLFSASSNATLCHNSLTSFSVSTFFASSMPLASLHFPLKSSAAFRALSVFSFALFNCASEGALADLCAMQGCSKDPQTGQGFPFSKVSAMIPACSSKNARFFAS